MVTTAEEIRRMRKRAGITTTELAKFIGVTRSFVAQRELGFRTMTSTQAARLLNGVLTISEMRAKALVQKEGKGEISK